MGENRVGENKIQNKILEDAKAEAKKILDGANQKADEMHRQSENEVHHIREETTSLAEEAKTHEMKRRLSEARMQSRRALLQEKRNSIDAVFDETKKQLLSLKKADYIHFISNTVKEETKGDSVTIVLAENDIKRFGDSIVKEIMKSIGFKGDIHMEKGTFDGGCIIKKDTYEFNATIDTILSKIKEMLESKLQKLLFE